MALTAQLDIETATGDGDTSVAIDPSFWAANQSTIQGYAVADGVTLYFQDPKQSATSTSANVLTLADAQYQIRVASRLSTAKATPPAASSPPSSGPGGGAAAAVLVVVLGGLAWALGARL